MIEALFSDVDRTILTSDYELLDRVAEGLIDFSLSSKLVLATARSPNGVMPLCSRLNVDWAICFNGGWIGQPKDRSVLWEAKLDRDVALTIMARAQSLGISALWYTADAIWALELGDIVVHEARITGETAYKASRLEVLPGEPYKIMCSRICADKVAFDLLRHEFSPYCAVAASNWRLLEFTPNAVSKGDAASILANHLGMAASNCAAAGDAENDLSMLKWAGYPVCVDNAIAECKALARYVGGDADWGGLADALRWLKKVDAEVAREL